MIVVMKNPDQIKTDNSRKVNILAILTLLFLVVTLVVGVVVFRIYIGGYRKQADTRTYDKYYAMIIQNGKSDFWNSVYRGALENAKEHGDYVELFGSNLSTEYTCEELMRVAIAAETDGIIVYANETDEMTDLINEATRAGIPVVTLYSDNTRSDRLSFVGVGGYNIGREYGRQVFSIIKEKRLEDFADSEAMEQRRTMQIAVLMNMDTQDAAQNIIISGLQETIAQENATDSEFDISIVPVDNTNAFSVEESIRDIFLREDIPDVIVCLDELNTICTYQAVVDFNKVGEVNILGYYDSESIINAIDRNVVYATVLVDTEQMGRYCVDALSDYYEFGNTSQYFTADVTLINKNNVADYIGEEDTGE